MTENSHQTKGLLRLTMACNEQCPFCNVPQEDYARKTPPLEETLAELQTFIDRNEKTLTISGGEPTLLQKRLLLLVGKAKENGISAIELQTNAILIDAEYANNLAQAGVGSAFVSLLSETSTIHDQLTGVVGSFEKCVRGIQNLLAANISVTLNPVLSSLSQHRLLEYIEFVHQTFPSITTISLSAIQPHGRAASNWNLLPDYQVLRDSIPTALERAQSHNIQILNPYCGLPLCIGWKDNLDNCVEVFERNDTNDLSDDKPNIQNHGNKSKGIPCTWCVYRSKCGGAWHGYWQHKQGSGILAPKTMVPPWKTTQLDSYLFCRNGEKDICKKYISSFASTTEPSIPWIVCNDISLPTWRYLMNQRGVEVVLVCGANRLPSLQSPSLKDKEQLRLWRRYATLLHEKDSRLHIFLCGTLSSYESSLWNTFAPRVHIMLHIHTTYPTHWPDISNPFLFV